MKILRGTIVSQKTPKTIIVEVERVYTHSLYGKQVRKTRRYHVYSEAETKVGDAVSFIETRPLSKTKRWKIVLKKGQA